MAPQLPPVELMRRIAPTPDGQDEAGWYLLMGERSRDELLRLLPGGFGDRVLDFGCGSGRIWALSVFTHLTTSWAEWLLELRRLLRPDGRLVATILGPGAVSWIGETWDDSRFGMNVLHPGQSWERYGPAVYVSEWWLREHWGRAFTIDVYEPGGFATATEIGQGVVVLRPNGREITDDELREMSSDPREATAAVHNASQLAREAATLHHAYVYERDRADRLEALLDRARQLLP